MSPTPQSPPASRSVYPSTASAALAFTRTERASLRALRARYRAGRDLFDRQEMARLRFVRWLYQTGRIGGVEPAA